MRCFVAADRHLVEWPTAVLRVWGRNNGTGKRLHRLQVTEGLRAFGVGGVLPKRIRARDERSCIFVSLHQHRHPRGFVKLILCRIHSRRCGKKLHRRQKSGESSFIFLRSGRPCVHPYVRAIIGRQSAFCNRRRRKIGRKGNGEARAFRLSAYAQGSAVAPLPPSCFLFVSSHWSVRPAVQEAAVVARAMFCQTCSLQSPSAATEALEATRSFWGAPPPTLSCFRSFFCCFCSSRRATYAGVGAKSKSAYGGRKAPPSSLPEARSSNEPASLRLSPVASSRRLYN